MYHNECAHAYTFFVANVPSIYPSMLIANATSLSTLFIASDKYNASYSILHLRCELCPAMLYVTMLYDYEMPKLYCCCIMYFSMTVILPLLAQAFNNILQ